MKDIVETENIFIDKELILESYKKTLCEYCCGEMKIEVTNRHEVVFICLLCKL